MPCASKCNDFDSISTMLAKKAFHFLNIDLVDCFLQLYKDLFVDCFLQLLIKIVRTQSFTSLTRRQDSSLIWNISLKEKSNNYMYSFLNLFSKASFNELFNEDLRYMITAKPPLISQRWSVINEVLNKFALDMIISLLLVQQVPIWCM